MYAVILTGGKQYKVKEGDFITVEKLDVEADSEYKFNEIIVVGEGADIKIGKPFVKDAFVSATVIGNGKEKKVIIYKYKSKKGFHKKRGHRQPYTKLKIEKINSIA